MKKKLFAVLLALCLSVCLLAVTASASTIVASGKCGDNLTWTVDQNKVLTISGTGDMYDYAGDTPWADVFHSTVVIEEGVTSIGEYAFYWSFLSDITIADSVTSIGEYAFCECPKLKNIVIPDSVTYIGENAFRKSAISSITLSKKLTEIEDDTFAYCENLTSITIPSGVSSIGGYAFYKCSNLTSITLPNTITSIGSNSFYSCSSLLSITLPASVTTINKYAFGECKSLATITFEGDAPEISGTAFYGVKAACFYPAENSTWTSAAKAQYSGELDWFDPAKILNSPSTAYTVAGNKANFTIDVEGNILSYQWQYSADGGQTWKKSSAEGNNTRSMLVPATVSRNGYQYRCKVTDKYGDVVYSDPATLHVLSISSQPTTQKVIAGTTAKFTVKATGGDLSYQWQYSTDKGETWKNSTLSSANKATLKVSGTASRSTYRYRCVITDGAGNTVTTKTVALYVLAITSQPKTQYVTKGSTAVFTVKAVSGANKTYQWQYSTNGGKTWKASGMSTANKTTLEVPGSTGRNGYLYRCKITDSGDNVIYSDAVALYVLAIKTQPTSQTVSVGSTAKFTVNAVGGGLTYQWQYSTNGGKTWKDSTMSTANKATLKVKGTGSRDGYLYRCVITDAAGNVVKTKAVTLTVE